jgi:ribosomal protein S18 acetylase RimI-like enzyme
MRIETLPGELIDDVVELWRSAGVTRPWNDPHADARLALEGPASTILAGFEEDRLVAAAMTGHDGHRGWVYYLAVEPTAQGRGHGAAMMGACEEWLRARDVPKLNLMVRTDNAATLGFYDAIGYRRDEVVVLSRRLDGD